MTENLVPPPYNITNKTPYAELATFKMNKSEYKARIANDILHNAQQLAPGIYWGEVENIGETQDGRPFDGFSALTETFVNPIYATARMLELDMHAPQIVYMSGAYFRWRLSTRVNKLEEQLTEIEKTDWQFSTEEQRDKKIKDLEEDKARIATYKQRLSSSLNEYAERYLSSNPRYLSILTSLLFMHSKRKAERTTVLKLLKEKTPEAIEKAYLIVQPKRETKGV